MTAHTVGLSIRNGVKVYPGTRALDGVDFDVRMGAVNVLVGENGAGKSTLMKIVAGVESLTEGEILLDGAPVRFHGKDDAERAGIGIVFQELNLFPDLTVTENVFVGREITRFGRIDRAAQRRATAALMARLEQDIDPDAALGGLRIGQQQIVEIAKALNENARILILDEPTSALSGTEVEVLFRLIDDLRRQGVGIVYISHRLEELIRIGDYITVLRDGVITGARPMAGIDLPWIVEAMIGDASRDFPPRATRIRGEVFRAEDVTLAREGGGLAVDHVSLTVHAGEILGVYGLMGAGRSEFLECILGLHPRAGGAMWLDDRPLGPPSVSRRIDRGVALIPEDRKRDGLIQIMAIRENITLSSLSRFTRGFHLDLAAEAEGARDFVRRLGIKIASPEHPVSSLSGGNQQKVVISKALMTSPRLLLMDEPSRGIDIGAKAEVFRTMRTLAEDGLAILFVTSDLEEVAGLADRIVVMAQGRITGTFDGATAKPAEIAAAAQSKKREPA